MNNFPNYYGGQRFQPVMQPMAGMQQIPQMPFQPVQQMPQVVEPNINYDFYGVQVKSFEEAKNYPYCCEKPLFLLDTNNERVYIKKIDEKGTPSVITYEMKEIKENTPVKEEQKEEIQKQNVPQIDFTSEFSKMKEEITQILRQDVQKQFEELKMSRENENKGNKKW